MPSADIQWLAGGLEIRQPLFEYAGFLPLDHLPVKWITAAVVKDVDDLAVNFLSTAKRCAKLLPTAVAWLIQFLEGVLILKVSRTEQGVMGKSVTVCSTAECGRAVAAAMEELGVPVVQAVKWLGVDYQPSDRKARQTRNARLDVAKRRWVKIAGLKR